jgi:hypothetical protein
VTPKLLKRNTSGTIWANRRAKLLGLLRGYPLRNLYTRINFPILALLVKLFKHLGPPRRVWRVWPTVPEPDPRYAGAAPHPEARAGGGTPGTQERRPRPSITSSTIEPSHTTLCVPRGTGDAAWCRSSSMGPNSPKWAVYEIKADKCGALAGPSPWQALRGDGGSTDDLQLSGDEVVAQRRQVV